ncbi:hypothetical protein [Acinetobacter sp. WCHAc060007]|jgi:hypothetical protein|uniref:hypothetical protein n=1 Tax=Acinetobacter sp. WCHAc060007 TaxID=2419605 RepID=UPI00148B7C5C|nr:hypothetical protein [Acinetobacter sp. WCHAc060007]
MLNLKCQNNKFDLDKSQKVIEKSIILAAQKMGSMRGVMKGDMQDSVNKTLIRKVA